MRMALPNRERLGYIGHWSGDKPVPTEAEMEFIFNYLGLNLWMIHKEMARSIRYG